MKRATLLLEDSLYDRAKKLSAQRRQTLKDVINDLLRIGLASLRPRPEKGGIRLPLRKKNGPKPGIDVSDRDALYDLMDGSS